MGDLLLPSYYQSTTQDYQDIFNIEIDSTTPPPSYRCNENNNNNNDDDDDDEISQNSLYINHMSTLGAISKPTLASGPPHLTVPSVAYEKQPPTDDSSVALSEKIKHYIRFVEVFSSIAKEDMFGVPIVNVKKEERNTGLRAWFYNRVYQLKTLEVTCNNMITSGVFLAIDCLTMTEKAVLHLAVTSIYTSNQDTIVPELSPFGFTFFWNNNNTISTKISKEQKEYDTSRLTAVPDEQIQAALFIWFRQKQMPCLSLATEIYRDGIDIYVVFDRYYF